MDNSGRRLFMEYSALPGNPQTSYSIVGQGIFFYGIFNIYSVTEKGSYS